MIKLLDHGHVRLIETWGSDEMVIRAARQSTDKGFQGWPEDERLLAYLYRNEHMTPFEMGGMIVEIQAPIMVFREWVRHRTQCLAGDTVIATVSPSGRSLPRTIKEIHDLKYGRPAGTGPACHRNGYSKAGTPVWRKAQVKDADRWGALPNCQNRMLRVIDEASGTSTVLPMADVWISGMKEIYEVKTASGAAVRCSRDHPFFTREGWAKVADLSAGIETGRYGKVAINERPIPPALRQGIGVWTSMMRKRLIRDFDTCYACGTQFAFDDLELDHVEPVYQKLKRALDEENLRPICGPCHRMKTNREQTGAVTRMGVRWDRIVSIKRVAEEQTYDIEVDGPHHNFIANGLIVHNSYNEMSGRFIELPALSYVPSDERLATCGQARTNKQSSGEPMPHVEEVRALIEGAYAETRWRYERMLELGVAREVARIVLPVGQYSRMWAQGNLRNWLNFLRLRRAPNAQWEIRQYADAVAGLVREHFPRTAELAFFGGDE